MYGKPRIDEWEKYLLEGEELAQVGKSGTDSTLEDSLCQSPFSHFPELHPQDQD